MENLLAEIQIKQINESDYHRLIYLATLIASPKYKDFSSFSHVQEFLKLCDKNNFLKPLLFFKEYLSVMECSLVDIVKETPQVKEEKHKEVIIDNGLLEVIQTSLSTK